MSGFNLDSYENVKSRKARFYKDHPDGRIIVMLENSDIEEKALFRATIYLNKEDQEKMRPRASGYALEIRDKEKSKNKYGKEFESVNFSSWTENAEESAVGRALDNAGYASNGKCSREEIEKSERMKKTLATGIINLSETPIYVQKSGEKPVKFFKEDNVPEFKSDEYIISFGKFKGMTFPQLEKSEVTNYIEYLKNSAKKDGKDLSESAKEFIEQARKNFVRMK